MVAVGKRVFARVTSDDIRNGSRANCVFCPIALAATRRLRRPASALYDIGLNEGFVFASWDGEIRFRLSKAVAFVMCFFDETGKMEPFSFYLTRIA